MTAAAVMGRLTRPADALLFELLYAPQLAADLHDVLPHLLRIDAAHVVMLARQGLLSRATAAELLAVNHELTRRLLAGEEVLGPPPAAHRGLYFLYERTYVDRLGEQVGGAAHVARSRNDINAAVTRLRLRDALLGLLADAADLLEAMRAQAGAQVETVMCGFTHQQPAQPTTLGHYLAGVLSELTRCAEWLDETFAEINRSPLGAAAGFGTSFRLEREEVARLLGFEGVVDNSADAVASRDYVVRLMSAAATAGVCLTRLSADLQTWAGAGYGFVSWPDDLVSTSSIMPQKRNPFVLENVRGLCGQATAALMNVLLGLKGAPFTNSVEVSHEATAPVWPALGAARKALRLTRLLIDRLEVFPERMAAFLAGTQATLTAVADLLVARYGLAFRTAHDAVGRLARESAGPVQAGAARARLESILKELLPLPVDLDPAALESCLDPGACVQAAAFGGGPAPAAVRAQLGALAVRCEGLRGRLQARRQALNEADVNLNKSAEEIRGVLSTGNQ